MALSYFIADTHLGLEYQDPVKRERQFASFLESLPEETSRVYLLGDIFDFWYEYKDVIPRKFTRTLGALAHLADRGVELFFINGNHDVWTYSYLQKEITAARQLYNDSVAQWNSDLFDWPTKQIVAARAGYTTRIPFTASAAVKAQARGTFF